VSEMDWTNTDHGQSPLRDESIGMRMTRRLSPSRPHLETYRDDLGMFLTTRRAEDLSDQRGASRRVTAHTTQTRAQTLRPQPKPSTQYRTRYQIEIRLEQSSSSDWLDGLVVWPFPHNNGSARTHVEEILKLIVSGPDVGNPLELHGDHDA
jgi:hypothetical protein